MATANATDIFVCLKIGGGRLWSIPLPFADLAFQPYLTSRFNYWGSTDFEHKHLTNNSRQKEQNDKKTGKFVYMGNQLYK